MDQKTASVAGVTTVAIAIWLSLFISSPRAEAQKVHCGVTAAPPIAWGLEQVKLCAIEASDRESVPEVRKPVRPSSNHSSEQTAPNP